MSIQYRPEIDGLRAVAITAVMLCHFGLSVFQGGYVGVDVFFVISGFLITSLIMKDLKAGTFTLANFWERRFRRILPPLVVMIMATLVAAWFLYLPVDYDLLGQQVASQAIFSSNILFKLQTGYFDTAGLIKPLLHTWSLAVEEQFYVIFPLAAYLTWIYRREKFTKYLWITGIVTFIAAAFIVRNSPSSAFYLLPFRAWELLMGSLLALRPPEKRLSPRLNDTLGFLGLGAILIAVLSYDSHTVFPGFSALLPCLGAVAIILSNTHETNSVGRVLSMKGPVFIGLISYSLYLWHWPIVSFLNYNGRITFNPEIVLLCFALSLMLATLSWHYIEKPVRKKVILKTTRGLYFSSFAALTILAVLGLTIHFKHGIPSRLPPEVVQYAEGSLDSNPHRAACNKPKFDRFETGDICQTNANQSMKPSFAVWGDSHADAMATAFYDLSKKYNKKNGYIITAHGCPPILGYAQKGYDGFDCPGFNQRAFDFILKQKIKHVILMANWPERFNGEVSFSDLNWYKPYEKSYSNVSEGGLAYTLDELRKRNVSVIVMNTVPKASFDPPRYLAIKRLYGFDDLPDVIPLKAYLNQKAEGLDGFLKRKRQENLTVVDPQVVMCNETACDVAEAGHSLYFNADHLSTRGASRMEVLFEPYFKKEF